MTRGRAIARARAMVNNVQAPRGSLKRECA